MAEYGHWKDNLAAFSSGKISGSNVPSWTQLRDGLYGYEFSAALMKEVWLNFHINHDYAEGTHIYPHVHFVPTSNEVEGVVRFGVEYSVAKGHAQEDFPATTTVYIEYTVPANSQYLHVVAEVDDNSVIPGWGIEPDCVIMTRYFRDAAHANDTYAGTVIGVFGDLHYRADRTGTLKKRPDFNR